MYFTVVEIWSHGGIGGIPQTPLCPPQKSSIFKIEKLAFFFKMLRGLRILTQFSPNPSILSSIFHQWTEIQWDVYIIVSICTNLAFSPQLCHNNWDSWKSQFQECNAFLILILWNECFQTKKPTRYFVANLMHDLLWNEQYVLQIKSMENLFDLHALSRRLHDWMPLKNGRGKGNKRTDAHRRSGIEMTSYSNWMPKLRLWSSTQFSGRYDDVVHLTVSS